MMDDFPEKGLRSFLLELTLLLGSTMTVMAGATISPALPQINVFFKATPHADVMVKMLLSVHALFIAMSAPFMGILMDRYGRKPVLLFSVTLYGVAGASGFFMNSLYGIILGRAFLGVSVAGIMSGFTTLIGDYFSGEKLNRVMGLQAAFTGFGGLVFLISGGVLADVGWRYPFLIYCFAFIILPGVLIFLYEPHIEKSRKRETVEQNEAVPPPPLKLVVTIYFLAFFGMLVFYLVPVQLPFYIKSLGNISNTKIGVAIGIMTLVGAISSMQFKKLKKKLTHPQIYALFALLMGVGYGTLYFADGYVVVIPGLVIAGCGFGLLMPNVNVWVVSLVSPAVRGKFIGGLTTFFLLGQFISPLLAEPVVRRIGIGNCYGLTGAFLTGIGLGFYLFAMKHELR